MNEVRKSDGSIVPEKLSNNDREKSQSAERVEERGPTKGNPREQSKPRARNRTSLKQALDRIRQVAKGDPKCRFTTLWHHVYSIERLRTSFYSLKKKAAKGVDGVTWLQYEEDLEAKLKDLSERLKRGAFQASPVRRVYIPKADGKRRPIGVPTLEDKIVQRTTTEVLNAIYEVDFMGFSYGFRPGRHQHKALDALSVGITKRKVNWVLDADIRGFFDTIDHEWLCKFVEHRIADRRVLRHVKKWLKAGVFEEEAVWQTDEGTPQGGSISPLLANVYLHYVFDLWAQAWRKKKAQGDMIIIRYADDIVVGFQHRKEADRFLREFKERLEDFRLSLQTEKTRLIEFGRFAESNRRKEGKGKPETFNFLGFTHICGKSRKGYFFVKRKTQSSRLRGKLQAVKKELKRRRHWGVKEVGQWLGQVARGHFNYYGVPHNSKSLEGYRFQLVRYWRDELRRRSQRQNLTWDKMKKLAMRWIPRARITRRRPGENLRVRTQGRSPVR